MNAVLDSNHRHDTRGPDPHPVRNEASAFAGLLDISEVPEFDPNGIHREMAQDFQAFLRKWDAWNWLGLSVLHSHRNEGFVVYEGETLVEGTDPRARVQVLTPMTHVEGLTINTNFRFFERADGEIATACQKACVKMDDGSHQKVHNF